MDPISSVISSVASNPQSREAFLDFVDSAKNGVSSSDVSSLVTGLAGEVDGGKGFMSLLSGLFGGGGAAEGSSGGLMSMFSGIFGGGGADGSGGLISGAMSFLSGDAAGMVKAGISYLFPPAGIGMAISDGLKSFLGEDNFISGMVDGAVGGITKVADKVMGIFGF